VRWLGRAVVLEFVALEELPDEVVGRGAGDADVAGVDAGDVVASQTATRFQASDQLRPRCWR
jgi:hypothetical protein